MIYEMVALHMEWWYDIWSGGVLHGVAMEWRCDLWSMVV